MVIARPFVENGYLSLTFPNMVKAFLQTRHVGCFPGLDVFCDGLLHCIVGYVKPHLKLQKHFKSPLQGKHVVSGWIRGVVSQVCTSGVTYTTPPNRGNHAGYAATLACKWNHTTVSPWDCLIYVTDISSNISSTIYLFAVDRKVYSSPSKRHWSLRKCWATQ